MEYTREYFEKGDGGVIMNAIKKAYESKDDDISVIATQCIVEIVRFNYEYLNEYMADIHDLTFSICKSDAADTIKA